MQPISLTVFGGMTFGSLMTLFLMPTVYYIFNARRLRRLAKKSARQVQDGLIADNTASTKERRRAEKLAAKAEKQRMKAGKLAAQLAAAQELANQTAQAQAEAEENAKKAAEAAAKAEAEAAAKAAAEAEARQRDAENTMGEQ